MDYLEEKMDKDIQKIKSDVNEIKHNNESKLNKMSEEVGRWMMLLEDWRNRLLLIFSQTIGAIFSQKTSRWIFRISCW